MKVNGIIAEYNPFHNGHYYQLTKSRQLTGADYTVAVISGNYVQRGTPALLEKHTRAEMALRNGADLVLELPAVFATASAEYFASGAVALLRQLNIVTHLCFGSECGDTTLLEKIARILLEEPAEYTVILKELLRQGKSYPSARTEALLSCTPGLAKNGEVLTSPNNILGIEYIKALLRENSDMIPVTVKRVGAGYHASAPEAGYASAMSIRQSLLTDDNFNTVKAYMPESAAELLRERLRHGQLLNANAFSTLLYYKLLSAREYGYEKYLDVSADLSNRIVKRLPEYRNFESFCELIKTKELTYTRISRCLLHILLNITQSDMENCTRLGFVPYARVLGFRKDAGELLSAIKEHSSIPLITKLADADKLLPVDSYAMLKQDIQISQLYYGVSAGLTGTIPTNEYTIPVVTV